VWVAVVQPLMAGSRVLLWRGIDAGLIDGAVNGAATRAQKLGGLLRRLQSGNIRSYAVWIVIGAVVGLVVMGLRGGSR